jgi:bacterioferritin-associated ferredoxin
MGPDDDVCLCFHVKLRKLRTFLRSENPSRASLISECFGAGTGCGWCVPFLEELHRRHEAGEPLELDASPEAYAKQRREYNRRYDPPDDPSLLDLLDPDGSQRAQMTSGKTEPDAEEPGAS